MTTAQQDTDTELKEEFILLIVYYVMVILAMICTILCTCRKKNSVEPLLCCGGKQTGFCISDYIQVIRLIPFTAFHTKEKDLHSLSEVESQTGLDSNCMAGHSVYHVKLASHDVNRKNTWNSCFKKKYAFKDFESQKTAILQLEITREMLQEEFSETGKALQP